jgi:hypothetical protein
MPTNPTYSFYFENNWVTSDNITSNFVDHSNHFEKGNTIELRSFSLDGQPHIFQVNKYLEKFLQANIEQGIASEKTAKELINILYELLNRNKLINSKIHLISYVKSGKSYLSLSASETNPIGVKENMELKNYSEEDLFNNENGEVKHSATRSLFFTKDDVLYTTRVNKGEATSFLRDAIVESAIQLGFPVIEKSISSSELEQSDVIFYTDSSNEINMVNRFDNHFPSMQWRETMVMDILMLFRNQASNENLVSAAII